MVMDIWDGRASLDGSSDTAAGLDERELLGHDLARACRAAGYWRRASMRRLAALEEVDRLLQDELGGLYESAPKDSPLGHARRILRTARPMRCPTEGGTP